MQEIWVYIVGFKGVYEVSNLGRVRDIEKGNKILKLTTSKKGYLQVGLRYKDKRKTKFIHRLVAEAFIPNFDNKPQVNHIDCDKSNNNVDNLEWVTNKENSIHAHENGLMNRNRKKGKELPHTKLSDKEVQWIRTNYISRHSVYGQSAMARKFGVSQSVISHIINKKRR